jgi:holo-[acyl-carrier protein] synthase
MVIGIGTDLIKLSRIEDSLQRFGERFASRVLTEQELVIFEQKQRSIPYFAKRWAAKEAAAKALGTGIGGKANFHDIHIGNDALGAPSLRFTGAAAETARAKGVRNAHISLSDEQEHALAFVVLST